MDYYNYPHLLDCNYSQKPGRDKYPLKCIRENNYLTLPNLKEVIFLRGILCDNNTCKLDHLKLYTYQQRGLLLMSYFGRSGFMFLHGYMVSFLYGILEVGKR